MAQQTLTTDDIDGTSAAQPVRFSFDGRDFEIDLSTKNRAAFEKLLKPYFAVAREVRGTRGGTAARRTGPRRTTARTTGSRTTASRASTRRRRGAGAEPSEIRAWAAQNGIEVPARGRLSRSVLEKYQAAQ